MSNQMIFKRYEVKYMLNRQQYTALRSLMKNYMTADPHGPGTIQSLYFDTPDYLLIRHSLEKPLYKEKLRLRSYGIATPETPVFVELKKKYDSIVYKRRIEMPESQAMDYLLHNHLVYDSQIAHEVDYCLRTYRHLAPKVLLSYEREAFYDKFNPDFRMTFDRNILWRNNDLDLKSEIYGNSILNDDQILLEVKTAGAIPLWLVHFFSEQKIYKTSFSKYGTAYQTIMKNGGFQYA